MTKEEKLQLMVQSEMDSFDSVYYPEVLNAYVASIHEALPYRDFVKIQFCIEKICEHYDVDNSKHHTTLKALRDTLVEYNTTTNVEQKEIDNLHKFWVSFSSWYEEQKQNISSIFDEKVIYGHNEFGVWVCDGINCQENLHYRIEYGEELQFHTIDNVTFKVIKNYIELIYSKFLKSGTDGRYPFTKQVNDTFAKFGLPYKMTSGKIKKQNYKTSFLPEKILNYEQFERKIVFSEQKVLYEDFMDKHSALQYIADAFCYFYSLFKNDGTTILTDEKTNIQIAKMVHSNTNEKQYSLIKNEIENVKRIINNDYDIRHNEYYRIEDKSKREALTDIYLVEYLYNRIYSLLYVLRLKYKTYTNKNIPEDSSEDFDLPF